MKQQHEKTLLALLFASGEPVSATRLAAVMETQEETLCAMLELLRIKLDEEDFPLQLLNLSGQYQLCTRQQYTPQIKHLLNERRNMPLTPAALEVLAAVAYNQPVTKGYVEQVRGVDSSGVLSSLVEKGLLEEAGRLDLPGRPIAYATTPHFLRTFGLSSLDQLPVEETDLEELLQDELPDDFLEGQMAFDGELVVQ